MKVKPISFYSIILIFFGCIACNSSSGNNVSTTNSTPIINFNYVNSFPHDTGSFTEGFLINDGKLYESTGATDEFPQTKSLFGIVDTTSGKINTKVEIDKTKYFGEGITFLNGKVYQLTYKTKIGFIYEANTFKKLKEFPLPVEEGWGMTTDGTSLIISDGTNKLTLLDPNTLTVVKTISVLENGYEKENLNELEYIKGFIYANVWRTNTIVKIDPATGKVVGILDLTTLANDSKSIYSGSLEMNGIAYDSVSNLTYVTGKLWPKIYSIKIKM